MPATDVVPLFAPLHAELVAVLRGLTPDAWRAPTVAGAWRVRDVAAHLLDGDLRELTVRRDGAELDDPPEAPITDHATLLAHLTRLNASWVRALRRVSPGVLVELLAWSGPQVAALYASLDPAGVAPYPVGWAGDAVSTNAVELGRQYTERWHHQQQIRDAVGAAPLTARRWLHPVLDVSMRALPHAYRDVSAPAGSTVRVEVTGEAGGRWTLVRGEVGWSLVPGVDPAGDAAGLTTRVTLDQDAAWRLFFNQLAPPEARRRASIDGDPRLAAPYLAALAVMA